MWDWLKKTFGGKSEEEKRKEQAQRRPVAPQPQPQQQGVPKWVNNPFEMAQKPRPHTPSQPKPPQQNPMHTAANMSKNSIAKPMEMNFERQNRERNERIQAEARLKSQQRAELQLRQQVQDVNNYYGSDAQKLKQELAKPNFNPKQLSGLTQSLKNRQSELTQRHINQANPSQKVGVFDQQLGGSYGQSTARTLVDKYNKSDANTQLNMRGALEKSIKSLGEDFSDEGAAQKYYQGMALQSMGAANKKRSAASLGRELVDNLVVKPFTSTGEGLAGLIDTATGRREKISKDFSVQADSLADNALQALNNGDKQAGQVLMQQSDEMRRQAQRAIEAQIDAADPIRAGGTVATAGVMPFAFAAQGAGAGRAAIAGARGEVASTAATTRIGQLVENASPQVRGAVAQTKSSKILNSTPTELVSKAMPTASPKLQAVAGESVANVLSGLPLSPAMTAQQLGSTGRLEDYMIETATGAALDAVLPGAMYGVGAGARYAGRATKQGVEAMGDLHRNIQSESAQRLMQQGYSPAQSQRMATEGGFLAGPNAAGFADAVANGRVFEGVEGIPRFEVGDNNIRAVSKADLDNEAMSRPNMTVRKKLPELLDHPDLYKQYPHLKDVDVHYDAEVRDYYGAAYDAQNNEITIGAGLTDSQIKDGLLHEIQHAIQKNENFAYGASSRAADDLQYKNSAGEAEARAVAARREMTDTERELSPFYDSLDAPKEDLIVKQNANAKALSIDQVRAHPEILELDRKFDELGNEIQSLKNEGKSDRYSQIVQKRKSQDMIIREQQSIAHRLQSQGMAMSIDDSQLQQAKPTGEAGRVNNDAEELSRILNEMDRTTDANRLKQLEDEFDAAEARIESSIKPIGATEKSIDPAARKRLIRNEVNNLIYEENPELMARALYDGMSERPLIEGGGTGIPRIHVEDLRHHLGNLAEGIPSVYKRRSGRRDVDLLAQRANYDDIDDFLDEWSNQIESKAKDKEYLAELHRLRKDPSVLQRATETVDKKILDANGDIDKLRAERRKSMMVQDEESIVRIEEAIQKKAAEVGLKKIKLSKKRQIDVRGPKGKLTEYVAVSTNGADGKLVTDLMPMDGKKHQVRNGMVVDKKGKPVGSYVGIDDLGQQYAYVEGKPVNITGVVGDLDAWGNLNKSSWDMDRLIEANAPDKKTARRVQEFTTAYKDRQEAQMKTELVQRRVKLQQIEKDMVANKPRGVSKKQLTEDLFRAMEKKLPLEELEGRYGKGYVNSYIKPTVEYARKQFDDMLSDTNRVLVRNGFDEIPRLDNYITHIQENPTFWSKVGIGIQDFVNVGRSINADINPGKVRGGIPDEIIGNTANTSARRRWNPFAQKREGSAHKQDFFEAIDSYFEPMLFNKYMTPAASRARVVERTFRTFEKAKEIRAEEVLELAGGKKEARDMAGLNKQKTHSHYKANPRSPFISAWQEYGNVLAGKTNAIDRTIIDVGGKGGETLMDASIRAQGIAGANTIPGSATAALAQTLSVPQTIARDSMRSFLTGAKEMVRWTDARKGSGDPLLRSNFMRTRYTDATSKRKGFMRKYTSAAARPMEAIERFTGELSWRSAYADAKSKGLKDMAAIREADIRTKATLAGRGIGDRPLVMNSKALGALTQFGLEVNNMRLQFWNDFSVDQKAKFIVAAYALNEAYQFVTGQNPLPDYIAATQDSIKDFATSEDKNDDGIPDRGALEKLGAAGQRYLGETAKFVPGAGAMANLLPEKTKEAVFGSDSDVARFGTMAATRVPEAAVQAFVGVLQGDIDKVADAGLMVAPTGQQARRTVGGLTTMAEGVNRTASGNINTEVDSGNPLKLAQAAVFGKNSLHEVQSVYKNNAFATNKKQTDTYERIREMSGVEKANEYLRSIKGVGGDNSTKTEMSDDVESLKVRAEAQRKIEEGDWKEENGLLVNKNGSVQRKYYKSLAESSDKQDDATYTNWMKAYNIDGASNRMKQKKSASATLEQLDNHDKQTDKAATAISLMKNSEKYADMPDWVKDKYYEKSGFSKDQVEYGAKASYAVGEKMDAYWRPLAQKGDREQLLNELTDGRRLSIGGDYWATTGIITNLQKEGYLTKSEAKYLKSLKFDKDGTQLEGSGSSGSGGRGGGRKAGGAKAARESYSQVISALKATNSIDTPKTTSAPGGRVNTKKAMQATPLKQWNGGASAAKASSPRITTKKVKVA